MAEYFEATSDSPAVDVAVVELILLDNIVVQPVQVVLGEKLAGEESGAAEALQSAAHRAGTARVGDHGAREPRVVCG
jgi:hypothetical protein